METFDPEMKKLLLTRLEDRAKEGRLHEVYQLGGQHYTSEQIIDEARRGTPAGDEFLMAEKQFMDELKRKMPR